MSGATFEIFQYIHASEDDPKTSLKITDVHEGHAQVTLNWMGEAGEDALFMLDQTTTWALEHGITGPVKQELAAFIDYTRNNFVYEDQKAAWISIRQQFSNGNRIIPRPHHDGTFWNAELNTRDPKTGEIRDQYKIGTVLIGPRTLFWDVGNLSNADNKNGKEAQKLVASGLFERMKELYGPDAGYNITDEVNDWARQELERLEIPIVTLGKGECVKWIVGNKKRAAIHSEPDFSNMPEGRLFITYMPGTEEQIKDLANNWKQEYITPPIASRD